MKVKKEYMDKNDKLILYGSGVRCRNIIPVLQDRVECIIDSDKKKWGTKVENIDVCSPDVLKYIKLPVCIDIMGKICLNYVITIKKEHCSGIRNNGAGCKIYLCECVGFS